jgi:hypothetical protein
MALHLHDLPGGAADAEALQPIVRAAADARVLAQQQCQGAQAQRLGLQRRSAALRQLRRAAPCYLAGALAGAAPAQVAQWLLGWGRTTQSSIPASLQRSATWLPQPSPASTSAEHATMGTRAAAPRCSSRALNACAVL